MKRLLTAAAILGVSAVASVGLASPVSAQQRIYQRMAIDAMNTLGVPCSVTATTLDCAGYNTHNIYVNTHADATTGASTAYVFNPYDGRSTHVNVYVDDNNNVTIHYIDSERGVIILTPNGLGDMANPDGWLSPFYPDGNPFSAAVQSITGALGLPWAAGADDSDGGWEREPGGGHRPLEP